MAVNRMNTGQGKKKPKNKQKTKKKTKKKKKKKNFLFVPITHSCYKGLSHWTYYLDNFPNATTPILSNLSVLTCDTQQCHIHRNDICHLVTR